MALYFITGNAEKFREIKAILPNIEQLDLDLDEIQSLDPQKVIEHKLAQAASVHDGEFLVEDTSLILNCLNGLPGTYIKWFLERLGASGIAELALKYSDNTALARVIIGHRDAAGRISYFTGEVMGTIVEPRGEIIKYGWNPIFVPAGQKLTYAEMTLEQKNTGSMRAMAARKLAAHLQA